MSDLIADGTTWLDSMLKAHASQSVVYSDGTHSVTLSATFGRKLFRLDDADGTRVEWTDKDFLVSAADLVLNGVTVLPQRGHTVTVTQGGKVTTYQVLAPGGEPPWTWCDPYRKRLRIHGKQVSEDDA